MTATTPDSSGIWARIAAARQAMMNYRRSAQVGRAMRGGAWTMAGYGVQTALRFISRIVVAKLLIDPAPLGTVVLVTTILSGLEMISDLGINVNIVQHKDGAGGRFLGTARSIQLVRSAGIFLIAALLAFPISWIYKDEQLAPLLLVAALSVLFRGLVNPGMSVLVRDVDLKRPALVTILTEIVGFLVTVIWAIEAPSAWALVVGAVASAATTAIASQFAGARVRFAWDGAYVRQIVGFGGWIILSTGTYFLSSRGEVLLLKGSIPDVEFGCFAFASMLVTTPLAAITQLGSQVLLPFLAGWVRDGENTAAQQFRRVKWLFTALAICFAWGAILLSPLLIRLLDLNRSYASLAWMVQFLGVRAAFDVFALPVSNSLLAAGASRYSAFANVVRLIVLVSGLYLTVKLFGLGLEGAIWVLIGGPALAYMTLLPGLARHLRGAMTTEVITMAVFGAFTAIAAVMAVLMTGGWALS
jgi:O-antigen/teichoic acid export membrane protein